MRVVATPAVVESMRTMAPQDHATYASVYGDNLAADCRRQPLAWRRHSRLKIVSSYGSRHSEAGLAHDCS
jgi:hypothetical protein